MRDLSVLQRESLPLRKIRDDHPKYFLTLDDDPTGNYDDIIRLNAIDRLLAR